MTGSSFPSGVSTVYAAGKWASPAHMREIGARRVCYPNASTLKVQVHLAPVVVPQPQVHFMKCPSMVAELLGNLRVKCDQDCHLSSNFRQLVSRKECCTVYVSPPGKSTMSDVTFGEVLASPLDAPLCPDVQQVCTHLVKRALQESGDQSTLILRKGGQVCYKDKQHL